jgi:hypothetical protein
MNNDTRVQINGDAKRVQWTDFEKPQRPWNEIVTTDALAVAAIAETYIKHAIYLHVALDRDDVLHAPTPNGVPVAESDLRAVLEFKRSMTHPTPSARVRDIIQRITGASDTMAGVLTDADIGALEFCASAAESLERKAS